MNDEKEQEAAKLTRALLNSVGLDTTTDRPLSGQIGEPVRRRSNTPAELAFARLSPVDREGSMQRYKRVAQLVGRSQDELLWEVTDLYSRQYGTPVIDVRLFNGRPDVLALLPREVATAHAVLPVNIAGDVLIVATHDPSNEHLLDAVARFTGFTVEAVVAPLPDLYAAISRWYAH